MKTRKQYMNKECTHHEYYSQFVNSYVNSTLLNYIGKSKILSSTDEHFNDIPLKEWDSLPIAGVSDKLKECGDYLTLAGKNCIYKAAARQIKEQELMQ